MAQESSFDVVCKVDMQELRNAVDQAMREIGTRYDFKGTISEIEFEGESMRLIADDEYKLKAIREVLQGKMARRQVPLEFLEYGKVEPAAKSTVRQEVTIKQGIDTETSRQIIKSIKELSLKVHAQIQGEQVRVTGKNKDDLQKTIQHLKQQDFGIALQFINFR